jgi:alanine or glycine:cation symporter, AGCS family
MVFTPMRIFTLGLAFNAVQANTIAAFLSDLHLCTLPTHLSGVVLALLAGSVFSAAFQAAACVAEWLLSAMALAYIALALHLDHVTCCILLIVRSAFGLQPTVAGVSGDIAAGMLNGVN